jgi:hypothetical protein
MMNPNYQMNTINQIVAHIPEAAHVLCANDLVGTSNARLSMSEAAHAVSATPDEMLAVMEYRIRHAARQAKRVNVA